MKKSIAIVMMLLLAFSVYDASARFLGIHDDVMFR